MCVSLHVYDVNLMNDSKMNIEMHAIFGNIVECWSMTGKISDQENMAEYLKMGGYMVCFTLYIFW